MNIKYANYISGFYLRTNIGNMGYINRNKHEKPAIIHDAELWHSFTKTIKPVHKRNKVTAVPPKVIKPETAAAKHRTTNAIEIKDISKPKERLKITNPFNRDFYGGLNENDYRKLKKGGFRIDARLDLHGLKQHEAIGAVQDFIKKHYENSNRCVVIITGKGNMGGGVLREKLPHWLSSDGLKDLILAISIAKPKDGGDGAFYVLLKRKK